MTAGESTGWNTEILNDIRPVCSHIGCSNPFAWYPTNSVESNPNEELIFNFEGINPLSQPEMLTPTIPNTTPLALSPSPASEQLPFEGNRTELLDIAESEGR